MERILPLLRQLFRKLRIFWKNLIYSAESYLRSKLRETPGPMPRGRRALIETVLQNGSFREFLETYALERGFSIEQVQGQARHFLEEIAADTNYLTLPFWDALLSWVFNGIYEGLVVDERRLQEFRQEAGTRPVVFVPNHRSHMDYMILSYLFYQSRIPLPYVCAGQNLSFWPLGPLFRRAGAFFIRRSYEGNKLYARAVQAYIEELIRDRAVLEFFIEGSRSRSGKLQPPRMGILSAILEAYAHGAAEDVLFVPTSLTYESVLEEQTYAQEQAGVSKRAEKVSDLVRLTRYLNKRSGKVYIQFGEAISLQQWLKETPAVEKRRRVEELAFQLTYGINKSSVVTPRSLVAMGLLNHPKKVMAAELLPDKVEPLIDYLRFKGCRFSEPLSRYRAAALQATIAATTQQGILEPLRDEEGLCYLIREEKRPLLDYYKNSSIHFFVSLAVVCTLLQKSKGRIALSQLEERCRFLQTLFRYEFTFSRRQLLREHLERVLQFLEQKKALRTEDRVVTLQPEPQGLILTYAGLIQNFVEGYFILWKSLPVIGSRRWEERELVRWLLERGHIFFLKEKIQRRESLSRFVFQNALRSFRDLGLVSSDREGWGKKQRVFYRRNAELREDVRSQMEEMFGV